jgi:VWFA-related protein
MGWLLDIPKIWYSSLFFGGTLLLAAAADPVHPVHLSVVATDSKGEPVNDLQPSELRVREDNKVQEIRFFRYAGPRPPSPLQPGEFANRAQPAPIIILLDRWNERMMTSAGSWIDLTAAFRKMEQVNNLYIYFLTSRGDLFPVRALPDQDADLHAPPEISPSQLAANLDEAVKKLAGFRGPDALDPVYRANVTFQALTFLGQHIAALPGRKTLLWVTHGFPLMIPVPGTDWVDLGPQVKRLSELAVESGIVFYPVDESGKGAGADPSSESRMLLEKFAGLTGGRWYPSGNSDFAIAGALADSRGVYTLVYDAPGRPNDRKEHKIRLESSRKGVRLLARESDRGDAPVPDGAQVEQAAFRTAIHSPFDASGIGLRVAISGEGDQRRLDIRVDPADIMTQGDGGRRVQISVLVARYTGGSFKDATEPNRIDLDLKPEQWADAQKNGIKMSKTVPLNDASELRVVVFDRGAWEAGSVRVPVSRR